ncbi:MULTISPECIES: transcriptional regulator [Methanohalophilus]|jgi:predicted transcriptional regulator|uniref:Transcriptional regulator n=1 Tax=Methanohalophilus euhalobius TaxID=51203 RepID=A0A285GCU6_9EURY|nr:MULTISPECIES: transcriptional regulator [Methanohalophilus]RSD35781.1 MAG: transcriptional regulator protein [Methanohalophilus sp.]ODV50209.1 MAG: transcriptional regulator protein [Methanohalophilus sp. 2-GBenrich]PQV42343.1 putative transcriptional regulator [Methanohalophilus euhalobius]RNI07781.1 transcriptional regulator [Methanohalophilus euhalobius]TCL12116.1 putative transcriptional regulator [Methanohalophilus euhalobius]
MNDAAFIQLDSSKREIAGLLQNLSLSRIEALAMTCLIDGDSLTSSQIENLTGLRQPEVSVAMKPLCEKGIVESWDQKLSKDRGRPRRYYKLKLTFDTFMRNLENDISAEIECKSQALNRLKQICI